MQNFKLFNSAILNYFIRQCAVLHCSALLRAKDLYDDER